MNFTEKIKWRAQVFKNKVLGNEYVGWIELMKFIMFPQRDNISIRVESEEVDSKYKTVKVIVNGEEKAILYWPILYSEYPIKIVSYELYCNKYPTNYFRFYKPKKDDVVFDVGACEGLFSYMIKDKVSKIVLFEPLKKMCDALNLTFFNEIKEGKVKVENCALGNDEKEDIILINVENVGGSTLDKGKNSLNKEIEIVKVTKLDSYINYLDVDKIDLIKVDIEGSEMDFLMGAQNVLLSIFFLHF